MLRDVWETSAVPESETALGELVGKRKERLVGLGGEVQGTSRCKQTRSEPNAAYVADCLTSFCLDAMFSGLGGLGL